MANTFPTGHVRVNPNTFETEMWDGKSWITSVTAVANTSGYSTIPINTGSAYTVKRLPSIEEQEFIFEFLKNNMRVAEYLDENGKIHTVQLEMRAGDGYVWEQIRRDKILNPL